MFGKFSFLALLAIHSCVVAENWVLSGQSNAVNLLGGKNIENTAIPMMNAEGITVNFAGSGVGGQTIRGWNEGTSSWSALQQNFQSFGAPTDVFIWYQGEANGRDDLMDSDTYLDSLTSLIRRVRIAGDNPDMTVVICQIGNVTIDIDGTYHLAYAPIRDAQQRFVAQDSNALLMSDIGRELGDIVHLSANGRSELASEIGRALLKARHGKEVNWPGPVLDAAVLSGSDRVAAHFAEVRQLTGIPAAGFAVLGADSVNRCVEVVDSGNTLATLRFERTIVLPAKLIYGYGNNPVAALVDESGNRAPAIQMDITEGTLVDRPSFAPNGSFNIYHGADDTVPVVSFNAFAADSVIEPFLSTRITAIALRGNGHQDTVTRSCGYLSLNPSIASASRYVIKGLSAGNAGIQVLLETPFGAAYDTVFVRVAPSTASYDSLSLTLDSMRLTAGDSFAIAATRYFHRDTLLFTLNADSGTAWSSLDPSIAVVEDGMVRCVAAGGPVSIVASLDGKSDTCRFSGYTVLTRETILTDQVPVGFSSGVYELGTLFKATVAGDVVKARVFAGAGETGDHVVRIWRMSDRTVAAGPFHWNFQAAAQGWREYALPNPLRIAADENYTVSVTAGSMFPYTADGFAAPILNHHLMTYIGSGKYTTVLGSIPEQTYGNQNYFRDVVFVPQGGMSAQGQGTWRAGPLKLTVCPSPFNPMTRIQIAGSRENGVALIYAATGRLAARLNFEQGACEWDATGLPSGVYLVQARIGSRVLRARAVLLK